MTINNINELENLGVDCYEKLENYTKKLQSEVNKAMQKALKNESEKELQLIRQNIQVNNMNAGRLRFALKEQEHRMAGLIKGIDDILKKLEKSPKNAFIHGFSDTNTISEDMNCPYCEELNTGLKFGEPCYSCHAPISIPWKEFATCPNCQGIINTHDIITDPVAHFLDNGKISCPYCAKKFKYKKYITEPEVRSLKVCACCNKPYIPGKRNWARQRTCSKTCSDKLFKQENPDYQKKYRMKKK